MGPGLLSGLSFEALNHTGLQIVRALVLLVLAIALVPAHGLAQGCPDRPRCHGCGCAGGPGYRGPNGRCVGFRNLLRICGDPPTQRCKFENAPGTGANAECAMRSRKHRSDAGGKGDGGGSMLAPTGQPQ